MDLQDQLMADLRTGLRDQDAVRKSAIRMAIAALKNARVDKNAELTEDEMIAVLAKEVKQRRNAMAEFERAGRQDLVASESAELAVLEAYLPEALSEGELVELARQVIAETGANSPKQMGQVMGALMPRVRGRADGRQVSQIVRELLTAAG
ncbi:MAG TPA: GatB/YqeY domain-containing protein [Anaerolineae bacterium]|nr:GatB/YqeY domain-containing protein [Anaerolineae bacterium]